MQLHKCDVLVIGAGASGLRTAVEAHDSGTHVLIVSKNIKGFAKTTISSAGMNAAIHTSGDSWVVHAADTLREGCFLSDYVSVETLCRNASSAVEELAEYGVRFAKDHGGNIVHRRLGGSSHARACFANDHTGISVEAALLKQIEKREIEFLEEVYITSLIKHNGFVAGAVGFDINTGEISVFNSKSTVLATGGYSNVYSRNSSKVMGNTGDGLRLAYEAGAELQDMEMVQFHPTGIVWPLKFSGKVITEAARSEGGILYNDKGDRFMEKYDPMMELSSRNVISRSIQQEVFENRGNIHNAVWLDMRHIDRAHIMQNMPDLYRKLSSSGIDVTNDLIGVAPTAHYSMGGIKIDKNGSTCIPGLYAVGEAAAGIHGAGKLAGNSLTESIVFGKIVGLAAARHSKNVQLAMLSYKEILEGVKETKHFIGKTNSSKTTKLTKHLQESMWKNAGLFRSSRSLNMALYDIEETKKRLRKMHTGKMGINFENLWNLNSLVLSSEALVRSAILRKESRGAHYRMDFPIQDDRMIHNIVCKYENNRMKLHREKVPAPDIHLMKAVKNLPSMNKSL